MPNEGELGQMGQDVAKRGRRWHGRGWQQLGTSNSATLSKAFGKGMV